MGPPSSTWSIADWNVVMQHVTVQYLTMHPQSGVKTANKPWIPSSKYVFWICMNKAILKLFEMYCKTEQMSQSADATGARVQGHETIKEEERSKTRNNLRMNWSWEYQVNSRFLSCVDMCIYAWVCTAYMYTYNCSLKGPMNTWSSNKQANTQILISNIILY